MTQFAAERRRSDRLWLTIPVRVRCFDSNGEAVEIKGWVTCLNRFGGRIEVPRELDCSRPIRLRKPIGNFEVEFRVVEPINIRGDWGCVYGVECLDEKLNFWDIEFRPFEADAESAKALLDCGMCHTVALMPLEMPEIKRLRTDGKTPKYCAKCSSVTYWWYAERGVSRFQLPEDLRSWAE
jgi:hypothetical protein